MIFEFVCIATCMLHIKMGRDCTLAQILHDLVLFVGMSCAFGIVWDCDKGTCEKIEFNEWKTEWHEWHSTTDFEIEQIHFAGHSITRYRRFVPQTTFSENQRC